MSKPGPGEPGEPEPDAVFSVRGYTVAMTGVRCDAAGVEVVIDHDFCEADREKILGSLTYSLAVVHPRLRSAIERIVIPDGHDPSGDGGAASANPKTRQICLWSNRHRLGFPQMLPETRPLVMEHECAHLLHESAGPPDADEWARAIELDGPDVARGRFVQRIIEIYPEEQHLLEDWANAVSDMLEDDRQGRPGKSTTWFRRRFPNRCAIIDRVLDAREGTDEPRDILDLGDRRATTSE